MKKIFLHTLALMVMMLFFAASFTPLVSNTLIGIEQVGKGGGFYIDVTGNGVRGRMGPGLNYQDTGARYYKGEHLLVLSQKNGWYEVRSTVSEENVWITSQFAKRSKRQTPDYVSVTVDVPVRLRLSPMVKTVDCPFIMTKHSNTLANKGTGIRFHIRGRCIGLARTIVGQSNLIPKRTFFRPQ